MTKLNRKNFPPYWKDDTRMQFLFSNFRSKSVNPEGWIDKMNFWINFIPEICRQSNVGLINHDSLCSAFERKGRLPQCLDVVLAQMLSEGTIMKLDDFRKVDGGQSWLSWGFDVLIQKPISWGYSTIQNMLSWSNRDEKYVILSIVEEFAHKILDHHADSVNSELTDNTVYLDTLQEECKNICTGENFQLALIQLQREQKISLFELNRIQVVKFRKQTEDKVSALSDVDRGILSLQKAKKTVLSDIEKLEEECLSCDQEVRKLLVNKNRAKAMVMLKKKKRLEVAIKKKSIALDNLETLLIQLQNSGSEKMVLDAYKTGVQAMKATTKEDLNLDKIDTTLSEVEETLEDFAEIQQMISKPVYQDDREELEEELNLLLREDEEKAKNAIDEEFLRKLEKLKVPSGDISPFQSPQLSQNHVAL